MELAFVIDAVRRYWWIVVLATVLGGVAGFAVQLGGGSQYESMAVLLLKPPSEDPLAASGDTERYVANQLAVLSSNDLAQSVANALNEEETQPIDEEATEPTDEEATTGEGSTTTTAAVTTTTEAPEETVDTAALPDFSRGEVKAAISFVHIPETDIVQIIANHEDPVRAQAIANGYLDEYFIRINNEITDLSTGELELLVESLADLKETQTGVNDQIAEAMDPLIEQALSAGATPPDPESVVPQLTSEAALLQSQIDQVSERVITLQNQPPLQVTSTKVQRGELPDTPISSTSKILVAAGLIGGGFMGLLAAVLLARLSPRLLGPRHAEEILGQPLVGAMPGAEVLSGGPVAALGALPADVLEFVDLVCVRAEASSQSGSGSLVVGVIGSERGAGTTTLAAAMANRFAAHGSQVLLVDADPRDRWLSRQLAPGTPGIPELMQLAPSLPNLRDASDPDLKLCLRPTAIPNLRVLGAGDGDLATLRRQNVSTIIAITSRTADVVVFDAGALMEASATVQLSHLADAVVLAIPDHQQASALETVNRQLRGRRGSLLAIWSGSARRDGVSGPIAPSEPPEPMDPFDEAERQGLQGRPSGPSVTHEVSGAGHARATNRPATST